MCVHLRRFEVSFIVTCEGSKGFMRALPGLKIAEAKERGGGDPAEPTTALNGDRSESALSLFHTRDFTKKKNKTLAKQNCIFQTASDASHQSNFII